MYSPTFRFTYDPNRQNIVPAASPSAAFAAPRTAKTAPKNNKPISYPPPPPPGHPLPERMTGKRSRRYEKIQAPPRLDHVADHPQPAQLGTGLRCEGNITTHLLTVQACVSFVMITRQNVAQRNVILLNLISGIAQPPFVTISASLPFSFPLY